MLDKVKSIVNSWWFEMAATGLLGAGLLAYGYPLYAGVAFGWATCRLFAYLRG
jgi:hypothetical protein